MDNQKEEPSTTTQQASTPPPVDTYVPPFEPGAPTPRYTSKRTALIILAVVFAGTIIYGIASAISAYMPTTTSPTTASWKTYTGDKFSFQYPPDIQVNTSEFKFGTLMVGGTGIDFPPDQNDLLKKAIINGTEYKPQKTQTNQYSYIVKNEFKTIRLGDHYFVRDYPSSAQGCFCFAIQYVTLIGNQFTSFSMAKAGGQPPDPKAPTLAPYQIVPPMSTEEYRKLVTTDQETLIKKQFGNLEAILSTLKTTQ